MSNTLKALRLILVLLIILIVIPLSVTGCAPCTPATSGIHKGCCINSSTGDWCCEDGAGGWTCW